MSSSTSSLTSSRPTSSVAAPPAPKAVADQDTTVPGVLLDRFGVVPWINDTQTETEHDARSAYVETFWLPVLGPSSTLLLRRFADEFDAAPDGFEIDCLSMSREIGLGPRMDKRGSFARTLERCVRFKMAHIDGELIYVRQRLPNLGERQITKLSPRLQALHHSWTLDPADDGAARRTELVRAAHLARTLLALGEDTHEAEKQLHRWQFHPSIAWHAVQWALTDPDQLP